MDVVQLRQLRKGLDYHALAFEEYCEVVPALDSTNMRFRLTCYTQELASASEGLHSRWVARLRGSCCCAVNWIH
jgi:hypothetical protein